MRILLIDNDLELLDEMSQIILNMDPMHDITICHSSFEALQKFRKNKYDIVITEVYLQGGIPGNELIESAPKKSFKVGMAEVLENPQIRGPFNRFLLKPIKEKALKETLVNAKYNKQYVI
ncbi:hypothetical protein NEF87_001355 [Candidatus Lokiarchaeum ossiferum]|uniref:Response regulatory domain-containing protein n=1 Tax=Candidatus Lokiarchaeum ossiferum TaxID=2951803 RepID=A0ABY6HNI9_9ARCH|nr:hypothetical protein NEF87_001355 [Candidatus Lokiarchaeum sp. B-35]